MLATAVCCAWGFAYLLTPVALTALESYELVALRFAIPLGLAVVVPRPELPWTTLARLGFCVFLAPYLLYTIGLEAGVPAGVASILGQSHIIFVGAVAWGILGERPSAQSIAAALLGFAGIAVIVAPRNMDVPTTGALLLIASTFVWSIGNVFMRKVPPNQMLACVVWMSAIPAIPMVAYCAWSTGLGALVSKVMTSELEVVGSVLYLSLISAAAAYAVWGRVLARNSASTVAPFLLVAPCTAVVAAALFTEERFTAMRIVGILLVMSGLALASTSRRLASLNARAGEPRRF